MQLTGQKKAKAIYEFGPFRLDTLKCTLIRDGEVIPLSLKAFEILLVLIEHQGQVVEKNELLSRVWPNVVVEENNLARNISALRKALDEHSNEHRYILTIPGQGYRFVADVREAAPVNEVTTPLVNGKLDTSLDNPEPLTNDSIAINPELTSTHNDFPKASTFTQGTLVITVAVLIVGIIVIGLLMALISSRSQVKVSSSQHKLWQLTSAASLESEPTWSPDGRLIAYSAERGGNFDIWVKPVGEGNAIPVTSCSDHDWQPDWAPEGNRLVFRSERDGGGIFIVPVLGGNERKISNFGFRPRWSPDGSRILFYSSMLRNNTAEIPKVYVVGLNGEPPREVFTEFLSQLRSLRVAWHPDGQRISVWGNHRQEGWGFWTLPLTSSLPLKSELSDSVKEQLKEAEVGFADFQWSPAGDSVYFEGTSNQVRNLWKIVIEPHSLRWIAGPERLTTGTGLDTDLAVSRDGKKVAFTVRSDRTRIWTIPFNSATHQVLGEGQAVTSKGIEPRFPDISPDGQRLVFTAQRAGRWELWEKSLQSGDEKLLGADSYSRFVPRWSRDSSRLVYRRARSPNQEHPQFEQSLVFLSRSGGTEALLTTPGTDSDLAWDWSLDGKWILGGSDRQHPGRLALVLFPLSAAPQSETQMRVITSDSERNIYQAHFSPDDKWISFCAAKITEAGVSSIYVIPQSGGEWRRITEGKFFDDKPRWAPDGRTLYFLSNRTGFLNVWGIRFDPDKGQAIGSPFQVTSLDSPNRMILDDMRWMEIALTVDRLILPIMEVSGGVWILENIDQ